MKKYYENFDKTVAIVMAVYEPNIKWLEVQLNSLNLQTYNNIHLYIRDDCSKKVSFSEICKCVEKCIKNFDYTIERNQSNMGSNLTFELLTKEAKGDFIAYCDQDDEWLPDKLSILVDEITNKNALLVCSDMYVIDAEGKEIAKSITDVRRHHVFMSGKNLAKNLILHNFVTGCTMLIRAEQAKKAVPFCPYMVHDHYLALWCAENGSIISVNKPLIKYRIHGGNQTGILSGVTDKKSYGKIRIESAIKRLLWLNNNFECNENTKKVINQILFWLEERFKFWNHQGGIVNVWKYRKFSKITAYAELILANVPDSIFNFAVKLARQNKV